MKKINQHTLSRNNCFLTLLLFGLLAITTNGYTQSVNLEERLLLDAEMKPTSPEAFKAGTTVVLIHWASWAKPAVMMMREMSNKFEELESDGLELDSNLQFVFVHQIGSAYKESTAAQDEQMQSIANKVFQRFLSTSCPCSSFFDKKGTAILNDLDMAVSVPQMRVFDSSHTLVDMEFRTHELATLWNYLEEQQLIK